MRLTGAAEIIDDIIVAGATQDELLFSNGFNSMVFLWERKCLLFFKRRLSTLCLFLTRMVDKLTQNKFIPSKPLHTFLGSVSHYSYFLPELYRNRTLLNHLQNKDVPWNLSTDCQSAFTKIKSLLSLELLVAHYNPSFDIIVFSDAFDYSVRAVIFHIFPGGSQNVIAHASMSLTPSERNYGQMEKETLAFVFFYL